ncbi:DNA replication/repair protein RecF [Clostridium cochlearium]|uniref:DNA replication and repair protein RecF n=1 Tax=Clostridium cochlearium TaxID=1494 RepID=A0A1G9GV74_CLOCO|nr:DNA replication/repair protein RecF [Clostridium cochlearium]MBV1818780.1 DNA replication/repair protein RecF [Bacteroidales bacterium MSK.15.36]NSJ90541.1 DNA replication/repair protein RecF [Coprococcus sp. MSK.21.13]MCG4571968.1 DNA replication/repair protein RecF [Clostridium cochlearium]MCG4579708.1 DNA replication/repair protein RecF [Clostridium cochlearium]SDL04589.1 DNA replication and repair protein RecF [Clostridium cochlearium]
MYVKNLQLINFRNYKELSIELNKNINIFIGNNAQGKTNVLESIYYASIGRSHRTNKDKELIKWEENSSYIKVYVVKKRLNKIIEIRILKEGKKAINVNSININKLSELFGILNVVIFSPEDLSIVKESPSFRRKFLDIELSKINKQYYYNLVQYQKVLNERNILLKKGGNEVQNIIGIYDEQLAKFGSKIIRERKKYLKKLNDVGKKIHLEITSNKEDISFTYLSPIKNKKINDEKLEDLLLKEIIKNRDSDIEKRYTSVGPHRDDFLININNINTRSYGSQGQQRTATLTIKFASLEIIKDEIGEYPVLLLDDVLSELDSSRQKYILNSIKDIQTIITCTGIENIKKYLKAEAKIFNVENGQCIEN